MRAHSLSKESVAVASLLALNCPATIAGGSQFQVNSYTFNVQSRPSVAAGADGGFITVWWSFDAPGPVTSYSKVKGAVFDASGDPIGSEFTVDEDLPCPSYSVNGCARWDPAIASEPAGSFVVVWGTVGSGGTEIRGRRFDHGGSPLGPEFVVSQVIAPYAAPTSPRVGSVGGGGFVVVWAQDTQALNPESFEIFARRYDALGAPIGPAFQVNSYSTGRQRSPVVASGPSGDFVVVWHSEGSAGSDASETSIQARRFDAAGVPLAPEFQVNAYSTGQQLRPALSRGSGGEIVVAWESWGSPGSDGSESSIQGQLFDASGNPVGTQFQVNSSTLGSQSHPTVAVDTGGAFAVSWSHGYAIAVRRFDPLGNPQGAEFQVNSFGTGYRMRPAVTARETGEFVVAWAGYTEYGDDSDNGSIQARLVSANWIFHDGFETGDTTRWSTSVPLGASGS